MKFKLIKKLTAIILIVAFGASLTGCANPLFRILTNQLQKIDDNDYDIDYDVDSDYSVDFDGMNENSTASPEVQEMVATITSSYANNNMNSFEKAKAMHDWLVSNVDYVITDNCHTAYGALIEKQAVCDGYSYAYRLLMSALGFDCRVVYGYSEGEAHAWNVVNLDGVWYQMDVTWDDPYVNGVSYGYGDGSNLSYSYFLLNDGTMYADHSVMWEYNPDGVPSCTSTAGMEWINGILTTSYSPGSTATSIAEGVNSAAWYTSQRYGTFYILLDLNYVGEYTAAFENFKNSYYETVKSGYGVSNINLNAWTESIYLVIKLDISYW